MITGAAWILHEQPVQRRGIIMRRCFVISPIGDEGSPIREHADDVFDYIVKPAMDACDIKAFRADHVQEPGLISEQMFRAILKEDLCIAILTGHNPNVFYELAVAQCAGRPVIVLLEKSQELPFDIRDMRCVYYDLKPRSLFDQVYVKEVVAHVKAIEAANWRATSLFDGMAPEGGGLLEPDTRCYAKSIDYGNPEKWLKLLEDTEKVFEIMGISLRNAPWRRCKGFAELLQKKAQAGCRVRVLLLHKENPVLECLVNKEAEEEQAGRILYDLEDMHEYFSALAAEHESIQVRRVRRGFPCFQFTRTDDYVLFVQYLYGEKTLWCPMWECKSTSPVYPKLAKEFDYLWQANGDTPPASPPSA
jgi:hypothetical protein